MKIVKNFIDEHVGKRVQLRRRQLGWSVERLAVAIGVTVQELERREAGEIRIDAQQLRQICIVLEVKPAFFFDCRPLPKLVDGAPVNGHAAAVDARELDRIFARVTDPLSQKKILDLAISLASEAEKLAARESVARGAASDEANKAHESSGDH